MSQAGQNVDASGLSRWDGQPLTFQQPAEGAIMSLAVLSVCVFTGVLISKHVIAVKRRVWG